MSLWVRNNHFERQGKKKTMPVISDSMVKELVSPRAADEPAEQMITVEKSMGTDGNDEQEERTAGEEKEYHEQIGTISSKKGRDDTSSSGQVGRAKERRVMRDS